MDQNTINLLLALISLASQLAPVVLTQIEGIKQQSGKSADEIFADAGITIDQNDVRALSILASLMPPAEYYEKEISG